MADDEEMEEKKVVKPLEPVYYKVFLNDMNSWFSRFIIENMRSDLKEDLLINYSFMGTSNLMKEDFQIYLLQK